MKKIFIILILFLSVLEGSGQVPLQYMIETSDAQIFIMWEKKATEGSYQIFRIDTLGQSEQLNAFPIRPVKTRMQFEKIFGKDVGKICKDFGVKYPEQILHEIEKRPDLFYIMQAVEPRLTLIYGNGYFDTEVEKGSKYSYKVTFLESGNQEVTCFTSPVVTARNRPPDPPHNLKGWLDKQNHAVLSWDDIEENRHAGYNVYRSERAESGFQQINQKRILLSVNELMPLGRQPSFVDYETKSETTYWYKVVSVNILGLESTDSQIIKIDIPPVPGIRDAFQDLPVENPDLP